MVAKYIEIASELRELIKKGLLPLNATISERKLAEKYNTGRSTISAALKILKDEGYVESTVRSGTRVSDKLTSGASIWAKLVDRGMSAVSTNENKTSIKYLTHSGKIGVTFGLHEEFAPYEPLRKAFKILSERNNLDDALNDFDDRGLPVLRETLALHLENYGIKTSPDNIVVFQGYLEAVYTVAASLLNKGTNLYCMQGDMVLRQSTIRSTGANMYAIPIDREGPVMEKFEQMIKPGQNMLYVNPINSFPSGLNFTEKRMSDIIKTCSSHNIPILENDFLRDIWVKPPPAPLKARDKDHVIYIGTMANSYVTGVRLGWAVLPDYTVSRICDVKMQMSSGNNSGAEIIVNEILSKGYYYQFLDEFRKKLPQRVDKVNQILSKHLGKYARWNPDSVVYTVLIEIDDRVDVDKVIIENPYFLMPSRSISGKRNCLFTNALGMTISDFENLALICAMSIKKQLG